MEEISFFEVKYALYATDVQVFLGMVTNGIWKIHFKWPLVFEQSGKKTLNSSELDDMSCRIDDLEKNIADLMTQAGVEELEGENKTPAANKS